MARRTIPAVTIYICDACGRQMSSDPTTPPNMVSNRAAFNMQWGRMYHNWEGATTGPKSASYELCNPCGEILTSELESSVERIKREHGL